MEKRTIKITDMSAENFADYGLWITDSAKVPDADIPELKFWNCLSLLDHEEKTSVSIVQTYGKNGLVEETLEAHFNSGETLLPTEDVYLVAALSDKNDAKKPDLDTVKAFPVKRGEGVTFAPGTWHHAPLTEAGIANTFVIFKSDTPDNDCLALELKEEFGVYFEVEK